MKLEFDDKINAFSEETSTVSSIAYQIENGINKGMDNDKIHSQILEKQDKNKFPKNLTFIDAYLDEKSGMSGCAFLDEDTGKVIIGFAGTNLDTGNIHGSKDVITDIEIGFEVISGHHSYYKGTDEFIKSIDQDYTISTFTGHSKGGHDAAVLGMKYQVDNIVVYNSAPLYHKYAHYVTIPVIPSVNQLDIVTKRPHSFLPGNNMIGLKDRMTFLYEVANKIPLVTYFKDKHHMNMILNDKKNYKGKITWFVSSRDLLNSVNDLTKTKTVNDKKIIYNEKDHSMAWFLGKGEQAIIRDELTNYNEVHKKSFHFSEAKVGLLLANYMKEFPQLKIVEQFINQSSSKKLSIDKVSSIFEILQLKHDIDTTIQDMKNQYENYYEKFVTLWESTSSNAVFIGDHLTYSETMDALSRVGFTKQLVKNEPIRKIEHRLEQLNAFNHKCSVLLEKMLNSVKIIDEKDNELSRQFGEGLR
ncbi:hypothetical protein [Macrococcus sp. DPC7161]|uniref:hypothetical protein n=1 Tax=Macrococcus sp. DPC7161 TaxID=2507060 RepID=UPI00100A4AE5|nr:hypothetical protein [Macrococcus sp. DPC7161]RXK18352.1 hypothetical protein ER639_06585 [Macrococcus sp. DPC7161]